MPFLQEISGIIPEYAAEFPHLRRKITKFIVTTKYSEHTSPEASFGQNFEIV
jgi:hypothetical protein